MAELRILDERPVVEEYELVDALNDIDETDDQAEANSTTISDNNGGRVELDEKPKIRLTPSRQSVLNQDDTIIRLVKKKPEKIKIILKKKTH